MAKPEWGTKRLCQSCGAKFYDLMRTPITCPKCAAVFHVETETRRRPRPSAAEPVKKRPVDEVAPAAPAEDEVEVEAEGGEDVIEDAEDLGEDEEYSVDEVADEEQA